MSVTFASDIVAFWRDVGPARWFKKDATLDGEIRTRFLEMHESATAGQLANWENNATGALALLILLDQFPRNMFRDTARMFATDAKALAVAERAIAHGFDKAADPAMRSFFYLPYMHSEKLADQERAVGLYRAEGNADNLNWAELHANIIRRFGRFPHRNAALGRKTTQDEQAFLDSGGFSG